eukprot:7814236-Pyramimonas_sp.AAC.1
MYTAPLVPYPVSPRLNDVAARAESPGALHRWEGSSRLDLLHGQIYGIELHCATGERLVLDPLQCDDARGDWALRGQNARGCSEKGDREVWKLTSCRLVGFRNDQAGVPARDREIDVLAMVER